MSVANPVRPVHRATVKARVQRFVGGAVESADDSLVREEPLEIRVGPAGVQRRLGVILRTPGNDEELVTGYLYSEGIVDAADDIVGFSWDPPPGEAQEYNSIRADLRAGLDRDWVAIERPYIVSSACGVCGKAVIDRLEKTTRPTGARWRVRRDLLPGLPARLQGRQGVFEATGGLHAAALFDPSGSIRLVREDVGRHNAVDKLVGAALRTATMPLGDSLLLVSGRAGYEIVAKAARAGIPIVAAVGAPSSLAVDVAERFGITLVGFLRQNRFNAYSHVARLE